MDITKVKELLKEAEDHRAKASEHNKSANIAANQAQELCPHTLTEEKSSYCSGSYFDRASTTVWTYCAICKKQLDVKTETHGYYG